MASELKVELDEVEGCVPRYLYRTYSDGSGGKNSLWSFAPMSPFYTNKLSDIRFEVAKGMIESHFQWESYPNDQFISWTDSLLWALQHAIRKTSRGEGDIQICILDTSKIETCSFFAASDLLRIYSIRDERKLAHRYYKSEYLYHGGIFVHGSSSTVSLNLMLEYGLFGLLPEMGDNEWKSQLCNAVEHFRWTMFQEPRSVASIEGRTALQIASLFDKEFTMPVMVALLSLRLRAPDDAHFVKLVTDYSEPSRDFTEIHPLYTNARIEAPETANFHQLMVAAHVAVQKTKPPTPDEMAEPVDRINALSTDVNEIDKTVEKMTNTVLSPDILSQLYTAAQPLSKNINVNTGKEIASPSVQSEPSRPAPFPARLPSARGPRKIKLARKNPQPEGIHQEFAE